MEELFPSYKKGKGDTKNSSQVSQAVIASPKVFSTVELLEQIFLHLPPIDIICARRTSRFFRAVMDESNLLKRCVFLEPEAHQPFWISNRKDQRVCLDSTRSNVKVNKPRILQIHLCLPILIYNDLVFKRREFLFWDDDFIAQRRQLANHCSACQAYFTNVAYRCTLWPGPRRVSPGKWLEMFITQPPVQTLQIRCTGENHRSFYREISNQDGLRVTHVFDALLEDCKRLHCYEIGIKAAMLLSSDKFGRLKKQTGTSAGTRCTAALTEDSAFRLTCPLTTSFSVDPLYHPEPTTIDVQDYEQIELNGTSYGV